MDKNNRKNKNTKVNNINVDNNKINKDHEDYGYDFIPHLNEWVNIDEQKDKVKELEDI